MKIILFSPASNCSRSKPKVYALWTQATQDSGQEPREALGICLVQTEGGRKGKIHTGLHKLMKEDAGYLINNFYTDYMLK